MVKRIRICSCYELKGMLEMVRLLHKYRRIRYYGHKEGDLTRFPEPTRVLKYPHIAMTGPGQRGYVASASGIIQTETMAVP